MNLISVSESDASKVDQEHEEENSLSIEEEKKEEGPHRQIEEEKKEPQIIIDNPESPGVRVKQQLSEILVDESSDNNLHEEMKDEVNSLEQSQYRNEVSNIADPGIGSGSGSSLLDAQVLDHIDYRVDLLDSSNHSQMQ